MDLTPLLLQVQPTTWDPSSVQVAMNQTLEACFVPSCTTPPRSRVDRAHLVVLDNFFGEEERRSLLDFLSGPGQEGQLPG